MKEAFRELLDELNSTDNSVGLYSIDNVKEAMEIVKEYNFYITNSNENCFTISLFDFDYDVFLLDGKWKIKKNIVKVNTGDVIEIVDFYDEIAWYSKLVGKQFEVLEVNECDIKIKRGSGKYSYYVSHGDYKIK